ncbi:MAG TPA: hypothetical protein DD471_08100, partial [Planctomycetes bacterium]|nr:hypothetical protein [Planctomycetota bacterium]
VLLFFFVILCEFAAVSGTVFSVFPVSRRFRQLFLLPAHFAADTFGFRHRANKCSPWKNEYSEHLFAHQGQFSYFFKILYFLALRLQGRAVVCCFVFYMPGFWWS